MLIKLGNRTQPRICALYVIEFIVITGMATIFLMLSWPFKHNIIHWVAGIGATILYLLSAYRFMSRIFFTERLYLDQQSLTLIRKTIFTYRVRKYDWRRIGVLHYEGKGTKTDHPLKGKSFDYFGFDTQEHLVQSLHHDGNLYFDTPGGRVYFGAGVYSWDAEEMVQMMKLFIGASLQLGPEWQEMLQEH